MADTINAVVVEHNQYYSLNSLTGIPVGTHISIQNQGDSPVAIHVGSTAPSSNTLARRLLPADLSTLVFIAEGSNEVWVKGWNNQTALVHAELI